MSKIKVHKLSGEKLKQPTHPISSTVQSPRKRKLGACRRIVPSPSSSNVSATGTESTSPTFQHALDTLLDDEFPGKLADIINQCVSSEPGTDEVSPDMSSETLERILNVTLSEPMLEGVFPLTPRSTLPTTTVPTDTTSTSNYSSEPNIKRPKLSQDLFPSEHDIDNFLDQIHQ